MNTKQFNDLVDTLIHTARLAREHAESIPQLDPAHLKWYRVVDSINDAIDSIEEMSSYHKPKLKI
jgi:hypothetical protein